ncbi:phage tail protein, partial [Sinosporangium album]
MPDTSRFKDALVKSLERLERVLEVKIPTALDTARLAAQAVTAKRTLQDKLGSVDTRVNLDTTRAEAQIGQATRDRAVTIRAKVDEGPLARLAAIAGSAVRFAALATSIGLAANSATQLVAALIPAAGAILALPAAMAVTRAATATLKVGLSGVGEAMGAVAEGDATKLAEAMKDLSPSARAFVLEAARLKDAFEPVRQAVQQRLFQGLAGSLRTMAGNLLPTVKTGMVGVSGALNGMAKQAMATMSTPMFKGDLRKIFSGTTQVLNTFKGAIGPLITLVTRLAIAGLPLVKRFASWASSGIKAAAAFVTSERGAAKLAGIVKRAGDTLAQLGRIAANIGGFLASFFRGANADGAGLLATIERLTARMSAWASSTQGQQQIANVFATLGQTASALGGILPILVGPLTAIAGIITSLPPGVQGTVTQFLAWSVVIGALGGKIWSLITGIGTLVSGIGKIGPAVAKIGSGAVWFAGLAAAAGRAAVSVVAAAGRMALSLAAASASFVASAARMVASMAVTAARVAAGWVLMGVQAMAQAVRMAAAWVIAMGPIGWVIAAVIALVALIVANWDTIKAAISAAWEWIKQKTAEVWNAITSFLAGLWNGIKSLFTTYLNAVRTVVMTVWNAIRSATSSVWNGI